jgi:universal stress protein E
VKRFKNILVGTDLSRGDALVSSELATPNQEAVARALWLAKLNNAVLLFFYTLDVSTRARHLIEEDQNVGSTLVDKAQGVLATLVEEANRQGVTASSRVAFGKSWVELIRQVLAGNHDLMITGTRDQSGLTGMLFGSTGIKLLRKCPCPVWITKSQANRKIATILVAHDLTPIGKMALELGSSMARIQDAQLHVLHALKYPEEDTLFTASVSTENAARYRAEAKQQIESQLASVELTRPAQIHIVKEPPDFAILNHIDTHMIELLVMGTISRTGITGVFVGNTAERLLPQIPCSVLAIKPAGFKSPITPE